jgi:hypothetical protein
MSLIVFFDAQSLFHSADHALSFFRDFTKAPTTLALVGSWLVVFGIYQTLAARRKWEWMPWAKKMGQTQPMVQMFNFALLLFLPLTVLGGFLNFASSSYHLQCYYDAYRPLHALLSLGCLGLISYNFIQLAVRALHQEKVHRLWARWRYAHKVTKERGISLLSLLGTPSIFFLPSEWLIDWAQALLRAQVAT